MAHESIPTTEPVRLRAGDNWEWDRTDSEHSPADGWTLTYVLRRGATSVTVTAGDDDADTFEVRVAGSVTQSYSPGIYRMIGRVTDGTDRYTVYDADVVVEPDPVLGSASHAETMLAKLTAEIEARTVTGQRTVVAWTQGGRSEQYTTDQEIQAALGRYREAVRVERGGPLFVPVRGGFRNA